MKGKQLKKAVTIFTPTYNRGYCLERLYDSLVRQTSKDFVWLLIDDGSTDNTKEIVKQFVDKNEIEILYYYQDNAGKMVAHNKAVLFCTTELFMCLDSDDILTDNAVEIIVDDWAKKALKPYICGILAPRYMSKNNNYMTVNKSWKYDFGVEENTLRGIYADGYKGETALVFKTDVIKQYPFLVEDGEKFIPEGIAYDLVDDKYLYVLEPRPLMICAYQADGYTQNISKVYIKNPKGSIKAYLHEFNRTKEIKHRARLRMRIIAFGLIAHKSFSEILKLTGNPIAMVCIFPFGLLYKARILRSVDC